MLEDPPLAQRTSIGTSSGEDGRSSYSPCIDGPCRPCTRPRVRSKSCEVKKRGRNAGACTQTHIVHLRSNMVVAVPYEFLEGLVPGVGTLAEITGSPRDADVLTGLTGRDSARSRDTRRASLQQKGYSLARHYQDIPSRSFAATAALEAVGRNQGWSDTDVLPAAHRGVDLAEPDDDYYVGERRRRGRPRCRRTTRTMLRADSTRCRPRPQLTEVDATTSRRTSAWRPPPTSVAFDWAPRRACTRLARLAAQPRDQDLLKVQEVEPLERASRSWTAGRATGVPRRCEAVLQGLLFAQWQGRPS